MKLKNSILGGVLFVLLIVFLTDPADYSEAVFAGLKIWASSLLPAMLPFMFISRLILDYGDLTFILRPAEKLLSSVFGVNKAFALPYVSGLLSGYPSAALLAGELCRKNIVPAFLSLSQSALFLLLLLFRFFAVFRIISRSSFSFPTSPAAPSAAPFSISLPLNALLLRHPPSEYHPIRIYRLKVSEIYFQNVFRVVLWSEASSRFFLCLFK